MTNQDGQLILQALKDLGEPVTLRELQHTYWILVHEDAVKDSVRITLQGDVCYEFIQRENQKYFTAPLDMDAFSESDEKETGEMEDKNRRGVGRRRRGSRGRFSNSSPPRSSSSRRSSRSKRR